jgi:hypothetical protein
MGTTVIQQEERIDQLQAELAAAACRANRQNGSKGAFIDVELDLWHALQTRLAQGSVAITA